MHDKINRAMFMLNLDMKMALLNSYKKIQIQLRKIKDHAEKVI